MHLRRLQPLMLAAEASLPPAENQLQSPIAVETQANSQRQQRPILRKGPRRHLLPIFAGLDSLCTGGSARAGRLA